MYSAESQYIAIKLKSLRIRANEIKIIQNPESGQETNPTLLYLFIKLESKKNVKLKEKSGVQYIRACIYDE
jgi:hypothetical protein